VIVVEKQHCFGNNKRIVELLYKHMKRCKKTIKKEEKT
jgi:hypothetical protein